MFDANKIAPSFKNLLGWREHHDTQEITVNADLQTSESGEYYQQKHPALRLDIIRSIIPDGKDINVYLEEKVRDGSVEMLNDLNQQRQLGRYGKTLLDNTILLNKYGWLNDKIINESRFVGFQIKIDEVIGLQAVIGQIGLQFSGAESFKLYLFHTTQQDPVKEIDVTADGTGKWTWTNTDLELNGIADLKGGAFFLGYYQDDVATNAINNTDFSFDRGACGSCNSSFYNDWVQINNFYTIYPFYVANGDYEKGKMFDLRDVNYISDQSYGLNLKLSVRCDLTSFFINNKFALKNLLALKVSYNILRDMQFSQEINYIEENLKMMIIRDLEGDKETKSVTISKQYYNELKAVKFNISNINTDCLPCEEEGYAPTYDTV